jgi:uroporphyrinogen decarboxylase
MTGGPFARVLRGDTPGPPPIWLMRQAGRYHHAYRTMRERHAFEALCTIPELAAEVALGPVRDFDFDAAILFSDLLFPLEALGMALSYASGRPELDGPIDAARIDRFRPLDAAVRRLQFQADALAATRARLAADKGLIGFVGGPWTLFVYAVEGTHTGALARAKAAPRLYRAFADRMVPLLARAVEMQLDAGADVVMVFDTAAGELSPPWFERLLAADLSRLAGAAPGRIAYYAKGLHPAQAEGASLAAMPWAGIGYDARWHLPALLPPLAIAARPPFVQGNFDPALLCLTPGELADALRRYLAPFQALPAAARRGWICGLGHGVLPGTPEANVSLFVRMVREAFS